MNLTHDIESQNSEQMQVNATNEKFDLVNAYRLLINAYIRSTMPVKDEKTEQKAKRS